MLRRIRIPILIGLVGWLACEPQESTGPHVSNIELARGGGGGGPGVTEADPPWAEQDTTLDVRIIGSGFDASAAARFTLDGVPTDSVRTNSTTFVSSTELVANITVDSAALVDLYDVEVQLSGDGPPGKKKGVGVDLFAVTEKGTGQPTPNQPVSLSGFSGSVWSADGQPYTHEIDGVTAEITTSGALWVISDPLKGKNEANTRRICADLTQPVQVHSSTDLADFESLAGADLANVCSYFTLHTRDESAPGLYNLAPGARIVAGGKFVLKEFGPKHDNWEWRLLLDSPTVPTVPPGPNIGQGVCIDRVDAATWTVLNGCVAGAVSVDDVVELWRMSFTSGEVTHVADFTLPFAFSVNAIEP